MGKIMFFSTNGSNFQMLLLTMFVIIRLQITYAQAVPVSDPTNIGEWAINTDITDEFETNPLDESKWLIQGRNNEFKSNFYGRPPSQFSTNNVRIEDGKLKLETRWEPDYPFSPATHPVSGEVYENLTTAAVISKKQFHYGYMEIKCKAADAEVTSSFWTTGNQSELDMFEMFGDHRQTNKEAAGKDKELKFNIISWNPASQGQKFSDLYLMDWRVADSFHVYGFEWDPNYIKIFADGVLVDTVERSVLGESNWVTNVPYWVWVDQETFPWHGVPDSKSDLELNSPVGQKDDGIVDFEIEYIRIWDKKNILNKDFFGFESPINIDGSDQNWYIPANSNSYFSISTNKAYRWTKALKFIHSGNLPNTAVAFAPFKSTNIPAGNYAYSMKVFVESESDITGMRVIFDDPWTIMDFDLSSIEKDKWVTISQDFTRNTVSGIQDRPRIQVLQSNVTNGTGTMYIDDITVNSNNALSVDDFDSKNNSSKIYPNPIDTSISTYINIVSPESKSIILYNVSGKQLLKVEKISEPFVLSIADFSPGLYFISLISETNTKTRKIIIK
jgi:beta-glucanase (GH16 family)